MRAVSGLGAIKRSFTDHCKEVFVRHRALIKIILDRDLRFIAVF